MRFITNRVGFTARVGAALQKAGGGIPFDHPIQARPFPPIRQRFDRMASLPQGVKARGRDTALSPQDPWEIGIGIGSIGEVVGIAAGFLNGLLRIKAKFNHI